MPLTSRDQVIELLGGDSSGEKMASLLDWLVSAIDKHIRTRTNRNRYEPTGADIMGTTIAFVDSDPDTITDSGNGFLTNGFQAGDVIAVSGSNSNDGIYTIASVVAGTITLASTDSLTAEVAGKSVNIAAFEPITEYHDGDGEAGYFFTREFPIVAVSSLHDDNDFPHTYAAGYLVDTDDYVWYEDGQVELVTGSFNDSLKNIRIIYCAGYATVPEDLNYLATKWVALAFKERTRLGWSSQSSPEGSMTIFDRYLDPGMMAILNSYTDRTMGLNR